MREVKSESKVRPLIDPHRSCQQPTSERERSPSQTEGEPTQYKDSHSHSHSHHPSRPPRPILFLLISAIVLAIATIIGAVFELKSRDFAGFNDYFNVFNNEYELENSDLSNDEYGSLCHHTSDITSPPNNTGFNLCPTGVGLREVHDLGYIFDVVFNEYEFNNDLNNIFDEYLNENFYDNDIIGEYYFIPLGMFVFCFFIFPKIRSI